MKRALDPVAIVMVSVAVLMGACGGSGNEGAAGKGGAPGGTTGSAGHAGGTTGSAGAVAGTSGSAGAGAGATGTAGSAVAGTSGSAGSAVAGTSGSAGSAAAGTTGSAGASGGGGRGGGPMCNTLAVTGDFVTPTEGIGTPPVTTGGTFTLGTYVLTKTEVYPPSTVADAPTMKHTLKFIPTGNQYETLQSVSQISGSAQANVNYDVSGSGKSLKLIKVCGSGYELMLPYTGSGNTLMMVFGEETKEYRTYVKQ